MKFYTSIASLGIFAVVLAAPAVETRDDVQTVHLVFHGGPASYNLTIPANGEVFETSRPSRTSHQQHRIVLTLAGTDSDISVSIIDAPDYNAINQCTFKTDGEQALTQSVVDGLQKISVGPPQPIRSVSCEGFCVGTYGDCYKNGQYVGPCCSGFCAANKCRPWDIKPSM